VAAFLTLAVYSFLYKDNPIYRIAEYIYIGVSVGYSIAFLYHNAIIPRVITPLKQGNYWVLFPTLLGLLYFARFTRRWSWLVRYPISFALGIASGLALPRTIQATIFRQIGATIIGEFNLGSVVMIVGVVCTLTYFFFSVEHKGVVGKVARVGIWYVMIAFGAIFGYTVMARLALFIDRVQFLLYEWIRIGR
jgi:hypothetical protein